MHDVHTPKNVRWYEHKVSPTQVDLRRVRVRDARALRIDNEGDDGSWDTGRGLCALDWMTHVLVTLDKAKELRCKKLVKKGEADIRMLLEGIHPKTKERFSSPVDPLDLASGEELPPWPPLEDGVCAEQIMAACKVLRTRLYLIDEDNHCFAYYKGDAGRGSLVLRIQNGHAYPVVNPTLVDSISHGIGARAVEEDDGESSSDEEGGDERYAAPEVSPVSVQPQGGDSNDPLPAASSSAPRRAKPKKAKRRVVRKNRRGRAVNDQDMVEGDTIVEERRAKDNLTIVPHEGVRDALEILVKEIERTQTLPAARAIEYYKGAVQAFRIGDTLHTVNQDTEAAAKLYKDLGVGDAYRGQGLSSVIPLVLKKVGVQLPLSHLNPDVYRTLTAKGVKGRMHKGPPP